jgi:uncharacterized protein (TIGR03067 family)
LAASVRAVGDDDAKEIQGRWKAVSIIANGHPQTDVVIFEIGDGKITTVVDGQVKGTGQYRLDATLSPRTIDCVDPRAGTGAGIYSLSRDDLKICVAVPGVARPTKFESTSGSALLVLKRQSREWSHAAASKHTMQGKGPQEAAAGGKTTGLGPALESPAVSVRE